MKRGRWILEQILGTPPPPPPPDVPELKEGPALTGTLRQRMEQHRTNASLRHLPRQDGPARVRVRELRRHRRLARARRRRADRPVGHAADGPDLPGPEELKTILKERRAEFVRCLAEKMLTYAIGRGLEYYDKLRRGPDRRGDGDGTSTVLPARPGGRPERPIPEAEDARGDTMSQTRRITRRTVLRGLGTAIALPWLESMARAADVAAVAPARRPPGPARSGWPSSTCPTASTCPPGARRRSAPTSRCRRASKPLVAVQGRPARLLRPGAEDRLRASATAPATTPARWPPS